MSAFISLYPYDDFVVSEGSGTLIFIRHREASMCLLSAMQPPSRHRPVRRAP